MRKLKKTYKRPRAPWNKNLIKEERGIMTGYGLRRKKELWKARAILRQYRGRARALISMKNPEEERLLIGKLEGLGILHKAEKHTVDDILSLNINNFLDRRLQTILYKNGLVATVKKSRQMIVHGYVSVDGRRTVYPSYIVSVDDEKKIGWYKEPPKEVKPEAPNVVKKAPEKAGEDE